MLLGAMEYYTVLVLNNKWFGCLGQPEPRPKVGTCLVYQREIMETEGGKWSQMR